MQALKTEAITDACAHLNNVALPNIKDILRTLQDVTVFAERIGGPFADSDPRVARARMLLRDYAPHMPTGI